MCSHPEDAVVQSESAPCMVKGGEEVRKLKGGEEVRKPAPAQGQNGQHGKAAGLRERRMSGKQQYGRRTAPPGSAGRTGQQCPWAWLYFQLGMPNTGSLVCLGLTHSQPGAPQKRCAAAARAPAASAGGARAAAQRTGTVRGGHAAADVRSSFSHSTPGSEQHPAPRPWSASTDTAAPKSRSSPRLSLRPHVPSHRQGCSHTPGSRSGSRGSGLAQCLSSCRLHLQLIREQSTACGSVLCQHK